MYLHVINCTLSHIRRLSAMSKTKLLNIRIDPELKKKAKKLAAADGRSLSNWVTKLIASRVEQAENEPSGKGKG
jgi:predicted HicB family RNase H-like nuclease